MWVKMYQTECSECKYYDEEDDNCTALDCNTLNCDDPLPCETDEDCRKETNGQYERTLNSWRHRKS